MLKKRRLMAAFFFRVMTSKRYFVFSGWLAVLAISVHYNGGLNTGKLFSIWLVLLLITYLLNAKTYRPAFGSAVFRGNLALSLWSTVGCAIIYAYSVALAVGVAISPTPGIASEVALSMGLLPAAYFLSRATIKAGLPWMYLWYVLRAVGLGLSILAVVERALTGQRAYTFFSDPNAFSGLLNVVVVLGVARLASKASSIKKLRKHAASLLILIVIAAGDGATGSLSGLLCLTAALLALVALSRICLPKPSFYICVKITTILLITALAISISGQAEAPTDKLRGFSKHSSFTVRLEMAKASLSIYRDHNWYGTGLGSYKLYYPKYRGILDTGTTGDLAHNDYIQFLQEGGPLLLCALLALAISIFLMTFQKASLERNKSTHSGFEKIGIGLSLIGMLLQAGMNFVFYVASLALVFGILFGQLVPLSTIKAPVNRSAASRYPLLFNTMVATSLFLLIATLGARALFITLSDSACGTQACLFLRSDNIFMTRLTSYLIVTQPTWLPAREFVIVNAATAATSTSDPKIKEQSLARAVSETVKLQQEVPEIANTYFRLADFIRLDPNLEELLPVTIPHSAAELYQLGLERDPYVLGMYLAWAGVLHSQNKDGEAYDVLMQQTMKHWDYQSWGDSGRMQILITTIPLAVSLHHCEDAKEMADGLTAFLNIQHEYQVTRRALPVPPGAPPVPDLSQSDAAVSIAGTCF